jgi:hypothetical protein
MIGDRPLLINKVCFLMLLKSWESFKIFKKKLLLDKYKTVQINDSLEFGQEFLDFIRYVEVNNRLCILYRL